MYILFFGLSTFLGLFCILVKAKTKKKEEKPTYLRYTYYEPV